MLRILVCLVSGSSVKVALGLDDEARVIVCSACLSTFETHNNWNDFPRSLTTVLTAVGTCDIAQCRRTDSNARQAVWKSCDAMIQEDGERSKTHALSTKARWTPSAICNGLRDRQTPFGGMIPRVSPDQCPGVGRAPSSCILLGRSSKVPPLAHSREMRCG